MIKTLISHTLNIDPKNLHAYSAGLLQGKAYRVLTAYLTRVLLQFDLSIPEWKLLGQLYDHGSMKLATLADHLSVEPPLVTSLIDALEKKELVTRATDTHDRRAKIIKITKQGTDIIKKTEPAVQQTMKKLVQGVSKTDMLSYIRVLEAIVNNG